MPSNLDIQHSCFFRGLHRLAVHNPSARCGFSTWVLADLASKHVVVMLPGAIQPPQPKVVVDALPGRQVMGEQPPGDAASEHVGYGVHYLSHVNRAWTASWLFWWY